jgi:hypothetical protein
MALGIVPGDPDSATKAFADLKTELNNEKAARKAAQVEADMLAQAAKDLKILTGKFAAQIPTLDGLNEVRARELCLERTTRANEDYKNQNAQLTKTLESKSFGHIITFYHS